MAFRKFTSIFVKKNKTLFEGIETLKQLIERVDLLDQVDLIISKWMENPSG